MSKNKNRAKLNKSKDGRTYSIIYKRYMNDYCFICSKRCGNFYASCSPANMRARGIHGSKKLIYAYKFREYKTWKHNRKTHWKE